MWQRVIAWTLWPFLVGAWITTAVPLAMSAPPQVLPVFLGAASLTPILVLIVFELVLPFRRDWSVRGDSIETREGNSNFAVVLPLWDMIFGTFVDPTRTATPDVGMQNDPIPRSFWRELLVPCTWRRLQRTKAAASS
jgi:hypothetical protein